MLLENLIDVTIDLLSDIFLLLRSPPCVIMVILLNLLKYFDQRFVM